MLFLEIPWLSYGLDIYVWISTVEDKKEEIPGFWSLLERSPGEAASTKVSAGYAIG